MLRTGLIVEVPAAEPTVAGWRAQLDVQASRGVPAHVTVLFPFVEPASIDLPTLDILRRVFAGVPAFKFQLTETAWFGDQVLWLAPEPAEPFQQLTQQVVQAFPDCPPYAGRFAEVVPHLTVGDHGTSGQLQAAEAAVRPHLPIAGTAHGVSLMVQHAGGRWMRHSSFRLA